MMRKRLSLFGVIALVFALLFPSNAFAIDFMPKGVFYQGDVGNGNYGSVVAAYNQYDAACYVLGKNPDSISATLKAKLSDPDYGGRFYDYAQSFFTQSGALEDVPGWVPTYIVWGSELMDLVLTDYQSVWYSTATKTLHDNALTDLLKVLNGEDLGGGDSGGSGGSVNLSDKVVLQCVNNLYRDNNEPSKNYSFLARPATIDSSGNVVVGSGSVRYNDHLNSTYYRSSARLYVPTSVVDYLNRNFGGKQVKFYVHCNAYNSYNANVGFFAADSIDVRRISVNDGAITRDCIYLSSGVDFHVNVAAYVDSDGLFYVMDDVVPSPSAAPSSPISVSYYSQNYSAVTPPSGTWPEPDTPVTPDPPEVPTPTAPTDVPDPIPTEPTVVWPTAPIVVNPPEVTVEVTPSGLDYTQLLTEINDNLLSIDSYTKAINSSLNSLRSDLISGFDDVVSAIRNVYQYLQHLNDILEVHCKHIRDSIDQNVYELELYLKGLFEWLPQQLNYDAEFTYDDSGVTYLLRRILNKIPGSDTGPFTYKPNPQSDEPGFWDWLTDLWNRVLEKLVGLLPDEMLQLGQLFQELTTLFPFSIPWDLFALLSLFGHDPVTPVFSVPWGYGGSDGDVQMISVDLSCWDGVAEMVRPVFLVMFCLQLALLSRDLLKLMNVKKGGD